MYLSHERQGKSQELLQIGGELWQLRATQDSELDPETEKEHFRQNWGNPSSLQFSK